MRVKITRGVYVKGVPFAEGAIVDVTGTEGHELIGTNYAEEVPADAEPTTLSADDKQVVEDEAAATKREESAG